MSFSTLFEVNFSAVWMYSFAAENRIAPNAKIDITRDQTERLLSTVTASIMPVAAVLPLDTWQNFYIIVGTAASPAATCAKISSATSPRPFPSV
jgi:hypothetical protein